jgi:hypothetical protein
MTANTYTRYCQKCGSEEVYFDGPADIDDGEVIMPVICRDCEYTFYEYYTFYGIKNDTCYDFIKE